MKISISQITTLPSDTKSDIYAYSKTGWSEVELAISKIETYLKDHSLEELQAELSNHGLIPIAAIGLASTEAALLLSKGESFTKFFSSLKHQLKICKALNIKNLGIGADHVSNVYENWYDQALKNLQKAGDLAKKYDVQLGLEFMSLSPPVGPFVLDNMKDTLKMVNDIDHSHIGYNLDLFHFYRSGGDIEEIKELPVEKLYHVHMCDIPKLELSELDDSHRVLPGEGVLPLGEIVKVLRDKGYEDYLSLELLNEELWNSGPIEAAKKGLETMKKFLRS